MTKLRPERASKALTGTLLLTSIALWLGCGERVAGPRPLLVVSGPDDFLSFEVRVDEAEAVWRIEAERPTEVAAFRYGVVPPGFRQTLPPTGEPTPLSPGDAVALESRTQRRVFLHRGYADSPATVEILEWGMRRLDSNAASSSE